MDEGYLFNTVQNEMIIRETNKQNKVDAVAIGDFFHVLNNNIIL